MHYRWSFPEQLPFLVHSWETNMIDRPSNKVLQSTKQFGNGRFFLGVTKDTIPVLEKQYLHDILGPLNEHFKFHHYDLASCLSANKKKMTIGVTPISVIHSSPGLTNYHDPEFQSSEALFLDNYA